MTRRTIDPMLQASRYVDKQSGLVTQREQTKALDSLRRRIPIPNLPDPDTIVAVPQGYNVARFVEQHQGAALAFSGRDPFQITDPVVIPPDTSLIGAGNTRFHSPTDPTEPMLVLQDASRTRVEGIRLEAQGTASFTGGAPDERGIGVLIAGASENVRLSGLVIDGFYENVYVAGDHGGTALDHVHRITTYPDIDGGDFRLGFQQPRVADEVVWTTDIAWNANAATVQAALEALSGIAPGDVVCSGTLAGGMDVTYDGNLAGIWIPPLLIRYNTTDGGSSRVTVVEEITRGGGPWVRNLTLDQVTALNAPVSFNIFLDYVQDFLLLGVRSRRAGLDGLKLRSHDGDGQILGGEYCDNGRNIFSGADGGDGIDVYGGGENLTISTRLNGNFGNGIQIKNDTGDTGTSAGESGYDVGKSGRARKIQLYAFEASRNMQFGVDITNAGGTDHYSASEITLTGGLMEDNVYGANIDGRSITWTGGIFRRNRQRGYYISETSTDVTMRDPIVEGTGYGTGTGIGAEIDGRDVKLLGGTYDGTTTDALTADLAGSGDRSLLTEHHTANIFFGATATNCTVRDVTDRYYTATDGRGIQVASGATNILIHHSRLPAGVTPGTQLVYGSIGSTAYDSAGGYWIKSAGAVDAIGTWVQLN